MLIFLKLQKYGLGTDSDILRLLTNPDVVSFEILSSPWNVESLLKRVANSNAEPRLNALIDTGALITGMKNEKVSTFLFRFKILLLQGRSLSA